ncbi:hypothetical protein BC936DRAFT_139933 [Jimgerdemannia flammicorona]|uniref:Uncharacterized protein n=1 Tax=Jimgerdemannia flammicorona TaxID=994334 RepID=A0A433B900_9FUNG|nr:hypothetical protein BC936DRAFT_139933 [Jimgerdemannia flammicorona]
MYWSKVGRIAVPQKHSHTSRLSPPHSQASIINQNHQLVRHVDATELDLLTHKPLRPVTFFLFTDLLMVAARPSYQANGLECCGLNGDVEVAPALSAFDSLFAKRNPALQRRVEKPAKMKFKGWIGIEEVELFEGCAGQPSTFLVRASSSTPDPPSPTAPTRGILGTYFQEQPVRLYALASPTDETMANSSDEGVGEEEW